MFLLVKRLQEKKKGHNHENLSQESSTSEDGFHSLETKGDKMAPRPISAL
jgi:hypothetical protein